MSLEEAGNECAGLGGLLQRSPGDKTLASTRPAAEGLGEVDGFEMDSADGPDVGSKGKIQMFVFSRSVGIGGVYRDGDHLEVVGASPRRKRVLLSPRMWPCSLC